MRTVIFDLDGTLADTSGDLIAAANAVFRELGHGNMLSAETDQGTALRGGRAMLTLGFERLGLTDPALVEQAFPDFLAHYAGSLDRYSRLYPGVEVALRELLAAGYRIGVCTNKPEALAEELLSRLGVRRLFASLIGADTLPVRKPDAAPVHAAVLRAGGDTGRAVLVGDTVTDREAARAARIPCLLVTFGPDGRAVEALEPEGLLEAYCGLSQAVARLIG